MKRVRFHPAADDELLAATDWYVDRSLTAATAFLREVAHAITRISEAPQLYPRTRVRDHRRFVMFRYPFDIVYRVLTDEIEIVAVAHHARRPGYWRHR
jgi:plasmid stabilization system protein ParE